MDFESYMPDVYVVFISDLGATNWISTWKRNGWKSFSGGDVKNQSDIRKLDELCQQVKVNWVRFLSLFKPYKKGKAISE